MSYSLPRQFYDFELIRPCRSLTPEEIQAEYGPRATRPIPEGYKPRTMSVSARIQAQKPKSGAKPWAVYATYGDGKRVFISSHHSNTAAENKADNLNATLGKVSDFVYTIGERIPGESNKESEKEDGSAETD